MPQASRRPAILGAALLAATAGRAAAQSDPKSIVLAFYRQCFIEGEVAAAFARYVGPTYTQHNPRVPDGPEVAVAFLTRLRAENPELRYEIKRVIAEEDLVFLHIHSRRNAADRGLAIAEIFRVANGRIVEHWDVIQPVPETAANANTMF